MKLPLCVLTFLPKSWQESQLQKRWDDKTDEEILLAYDDAFGWIRLGNGILASATIVSIADHCRERLNKYIKPQIERRGLET